MTDGLNAIDGSPDEIPERDERCYWSGAMPLLQTLLAHLADLDFAHDVALEEVRAASLSEEVKAARLRILERRHQERRAPYARQVQLLSGACAPEEIEPPHSPRVVRANAKTRSRSR